MRSVGSGVPASDPDRTEWTGALLPRSADNSRHHGSVDGCGSPPVGCKRERLSDLLQLLVATQLVRKGGSTGLISS